LQEWYCDDDVNTPKFSARPSAFEVPLRKLVEYYLDTRNKLGEPEGMKYTALTRPYTARLNKTNCRQGTVHIRKWNVPIAQERKDGQVDIGELGGE
jgi:hypothetical protein